MIGIYIYFVKNIEVDTINLSQMWCVNKKKIKIFVDFNKKLFSKM